MKTKLMLAMSLILSSSYAFAQEDESDFSQPGRSETIVEEYGPAHSALNDAQEAKQRPFANMTPEPAVKEGKLGRSNHVAIKAKKVSKIAKHKTSKHHVNHVAAKPKKKHTVAKQQKHPSRSIASVTMTKKKHKKVLAKRGGSAKHVYR